MRLHACLRHVDRNGKRGAPIDGAPAAGCRRIEKKKRHPPGGRRLLDVHILFIFRDKMEPSFGQNGTIFWSFWNPLLDKMEP